MTIDLIPTETGKEKQDREKAEELVGKAESLVLHPTTHTKSLSVGGTTLTLRPLPIAISKKINASIASIYSELTKVQSGEADENTQDRIASSLESVVEILIEFYQAKKLRPIEEKLSMTEIFAIIDAQVEVNGSNDFLLNGLNVISKALQTASTQQTQKANQIILEAISTLRSANSGE
jgi:hypothetical protein